MTDHTHDVRDLNIDVAPLDHDHSYLDVHGSAQEHHNHTAADLSGVSAQAEVRLVMENLEHLTRQVEALERRAEAERIAVTEAIAEGNRGSAEKIAAAIERRCDLMAGFDKHKYLRTQLRELAREIRESASR